MISKYLYHIFVTSVLPALAVGSGPWQVCPQNSTLFYLSSTSSLNFQAFRMTIVITTGRITFHDFNCLVSQGDNGGPLVHLEKDGVYTQVGIGTFLAVVGCDTPYPAGFTRVTSYLSWISAKTGIAIVNKHSNGDTKNEHRSTVSFSSIKVMN